MATTPALPETRGPRRIRWFRLLLVIPLAYLAICIVLMLLENWMLYKGLTAQEDWSPPPPALAAEDVWLTSADGTRIHAWWCPTPGADRALLFCHGNGGNLSHRGDAIRNLRDTLGKNGQPISVLLIDYPGYGKSEGTPSEAGCYAAADAAYDWLAQRVAPGKIVLFGESLGGGVVTELASRRDHQCLVLFMTFTSMPDVAQGLFPWLPCRWLVRNRYDNLAKIARCSRPILVAHGDSDTLVPIALSRQLFDAAPEPKQFYELQGHGHDGALTPGFLASLLRLIKDSGNGPATAAK